MAFEALERAMMSHGFKVHSTCTCVTEQGPWKRKALKSMLANHKSATIFGETGDLSQSLLRDANGQVVPVRPTFDILLAGIVCVDVSQLTSVPKSAVHGNGPSAQSVNQMFMYLNILPFEDRPQAIILECVKGVDALEAQGPKEG